MSLEDARKFLDEFQANAEFRSSMEKAPDDETRQKMALDAGYDFSREEMKDVMSSDATISDDDLEAVAGGKSAAWIGAGAAVIGAAAAAGA